MPDSDTPLYDAIGFGVGKLRKELLDKKDYNVLVTILTDGEENASKEYSGINIKSLIEELKEHKWTFTYIGTEHDVEKTAISISINNSVVFKKTDASIKDYFVRERVVRENYSAKIRRNENTRDDFY